MPVLKHVPVQWLSLECYINRILERFASLKSYFLSGKWQMNVLKDSNIFFFFQNSPLEPALLFQANTITKFIISIYYRGMSHQFI